MVELLANCRLIDFAPPNGNHDDVSLDTKSFLEAIALFLGLEILATIAVEKRYKLLMLNALILDCNTQFCAVTI